MSNERDQKMGWEELPAGAVVLEAGSASSYETGDWRSIRPVFHADKCINCFICWVYCPDASIAVENGKVSGIDYYHCKGCGICSQECPTKPEKAITMMDESEAERAEELVKSESEGR